MLPEVALQRIFSDERGLAVAALEVRVANGFSEILFSFRFLFRNFDRFVFELGRALWQNGRCDYWKLSFLFRNFSFSDLKIVNLVSTVHNYEGTSIIHKHLKLKNGGH